MNKCDGFCCRDQTVGGQCSGNTTDFDSVITGSIPVPSAKFYGCSSVDKSSWLLPNRSGVRISPAVPINGVSSVMVAQLSVKQLDRVRFPLSPQSNALLDKLVKSSLSKGEVFPVRIRGRVPNIASETWKSERSYKPFSARLAFLRRFDPFRWYQNSG